MSQDDFDMFSNLDALDDSAPLKFSNDTDGAEGASGGGGSPFMDSEEIMDSDDLPSFDQTPPQNLTNSDVSEMGKKGQQMMKRYQKLQETIHKQAKRQNEIQQRKEMRQQGLLNPFHRTSTPTNRRKRVWGRSARRRYHQVNFMESYEGPSAGSASMLSRNRSSFYDDAITIGGQDMDDDYELQEAYRRSLREQSSSKSISSVDLSQEIDYEITIKLKWKDQIERFPFKNFKHFQDLYKILSEREGVPIDRIILMKQNKIIAHTDTPSSIGYTSVDFINGQILEQELITPRTSQKADMQLKIQSDRWRKPISLGAQKADTVGRLLRKCALQMNCPPDDIYLRFDGEILDNSMTLLDLELEGGEMLDCVFKR